MDVTHAVFLYEINIFSWNTTEICRIICESQSKCMENSFWEDKGLIVILPIPVATPRNGFICIQTYKVQ